MPDAPPDSAPAARDVDPEALVRDLRRQISEVRSQMEAHRETMLAAGLTDVTPLNEPASWAPRDDDPPLLAPRRGRRGLFDS